MNRHDRRKAKAADKAMPLTPELADQYGLAIQNMQDAMGIVAILIKKLGGEVEIKADDFVMQYQIAEERIPFGLKLKLHEITRTEYHAMTGDGELLN